LSKLKAYLSKHGIKQKDVVSWVKEIGGCNLSEAKLSQHNRGLKLEKDIEILIMDYLGSKGFKPARKTIF